jgi:hypothetical protein
MLGMDDRSEGSDRPDDDELEWSKVVKYFRIAAPWQNQDENRVRLL